MSRLKRVDEVLSNFIIFGELMDEEDRRFTAELLFLFLYDPDYPALVQLEKSAIKKEHPNWYRLLKRLLEEEDLRKMTTNNEDFSFSVAKETLTWCRKTYQQFSASNSHVQEENQLAHLQTHGGSTTPEQWKDTLDQLVVRYPHHKKTWDFYKSTLQTAINKGEQESGETEQKRMAQDIYIVRQNILEDWSNQLTTQKSLKEEEFLESTFDRYYHHLRQKVDQLQELGDLLAPFYNFLGHVWNDSIGNWTKIDWKQLESFAKQLTRDKHLRELAEMLGRWQMAQKSLKEEQLQMPVPKEEWRPNPYGKSEVIGIHHSDEISALLPSEVALLSDPSTELIFAKKFVEKKLLTFQYRSLDFSSETVIQEEVSYQAESEDNGPVIICIDTSGSMFGAPERIAKALALAILEICLREKRKAFLISFSTGIQTTEMTGIEKDLAQMVEFLKMSFHGGTDIQPALEKALEMLDTQSYKKADILVISDFVVPRIDRKLYDNIQEHRQEKSVSFHSLFVTRRPDPRIPPLPIFDNHWVYDLDNPKVMRQTIDHFQVLEPDEI